MDRVLVNDIDASIARLKDEIAALKCPARVKPLPLKRSLVSVGEQNIALEENVAT